MLSDEKITEIINKAEAIIRTSAVMPRFDPNHSNFLLQSPLLNSIVGYLIAAEQDGEQQTLHG